MEKLIEKLSGVLALGIFEIAVAKSDDVNAGPYKIDGNGGEYKTPNPMGSYLTKDPNGQVLGVIDHNAGPGGLPAGIASYINKLQTGKGTEEKSQNLFQR